MAKRGRVRAASPKSQRVAAQHSHRSRAPGDKLDMGAGGPLGPPGPGPGAAATMPGQMGGGVNPMGPMGPPIGDVGAAAKREAHGHSKVQQAARKPSVGATLARFKRKGGP
jgi:hypothetical protein